MLKITDTLAEIIALALKTGECKVVERAGYHIEFLLKRKKDSKDSWDLYSNRILVLKNLFGENFNMGIKGTDRGVLVRIILGTARELKEDVLFEELKKDIRKLVEGKKVTKNEIKRHHR